MSAVKLALIQMRSGVDPERNLDDAEALIREAAAGGATFVLTPETTTLVQKDAERLFQQIHTPEVEPAIVRFADLADSLGIDLLIGSMALKGGASSDGRERAVNRSHLFGPDGTLKATYDKIHMFDVALGGGASSSGSKAQGKPGGRGSPGKGGGGGGGGGKRGGGKPRGRGK